MREIKFRGYDQEHKQWVYGWYTKMVEGIRRFDAIISDTDGELTRFYIHDPDTIEQYTGLHDKDGDEIYEGDVLLSSYGIPPRKVQGAVEYDGSAFIIRLPGHSPSLVTIHSLLEYLGDVYVIGNIHENSELLK